VRRPLKSKTFCKYCNWDLLQSNILMILMDIKFKISKSKENL